MRQEIARDMRRQILGGLVAGAAIVGAALILRLLHVQGGELKVRVINIIMGVFIAWLGNNLPKQSVHLLAIARSPQQAQRLRRTAGLLLFAGGLLFSLAWLAAPMAWALPLSLAALGGAILVTMAQCVWASQRHNA